MKRIVYCILLIMSVLPLSAQVDRKEVRAGNRKFRKGDFAASEIDYRKAVLKDSLSVAGEYNLASSLYRQQNYEEAAEALGRADAEVAGTPYAADYYYNEGDVALQRKNYSAAVNAFKQALLLNPGDIDAKENYIYAKEMLKNQQGGGGGQDNQDQQNQQDQNDQNQDQNQNQDDQNDQNQDQQNQDQQQQQQPQPQEQNISQQQARQMLKAIQAQEKETQDKVKKEKAAMLKSRRKEKNW
ncbi:MAG: tetratricopeptide repeat protein [Bacteroidales bacterium]|nr:tetratricopeptide repeat protein [Bacteroidales bacterium]